MKREDFSVVGATGGWCHQYSEAISARTGLSSWGARGGCGDLRGSVISGAGGFRMGGMLGKGARWNWAPQTGGRVLPWREGLGHGRNVFFSLRHPSVPGVGHVTSLSRLHCGPSPCWGLDTALSHH